jgi:hypothetical protein
MNSGRLAILIGVAMFAILILIGCGSSKKANDNQAKYVMDESLLGPIFEIPTTAKSLRLPNTFVPLADSELVSARAYVRQQLGDGMGMSLQQIYHEDSSQSTIWIYSIDSLNTSTDTAAFINYYRQGLLTAFGDSNVKIDNYTYDGILVREFIVKAVDQAYMKTHLICISNEKNGLILEYNTPILKYDTFKKAFESSIASLKVIG